MKPKEVADAFAEVAEAGKELTLTRLTDRSNKLINREMEGIESLGHDELVITNSLDALLELSTAGEGALVNGLDDDFTLIYFKSADSIDDDSILPGFALRKVKDGETGQVRYEVKLVQVKRDGEENNVAELRTSEYYTPVFIKATDEEVDDESVFTAAIAGESLRFNPDPKTDIEISDLLLNEPGYWAEGLNMAVPEIPAKLDLSEKIAQLQVRIAGSEPSIIWVEKARSDIRTTHIVHTFRGIMDAIGNEKITSPNIGHSLADDQITNIRNISGFYEEVAA